MYAVARDVTDRRRADAEVQRLADEQAALRRVATLVAEDVAPEELFGAVAREAGTLLGADFAGMLRLEDDGTATGVATWPPRATTRRFPSAWPLEAGDPTTMIGEPKQAARVDDWAAVPGPLAAFIRDEMGVRSSVGCPIVVEGRLWGGLAVHSRQHAPLSPDSASRLQNFTDLVGTRSRTGPRARRLRGWRRNTRRSGGWRRFVAREASQAEVFTAIAEETGHLLGTEEIPDAALRGRPQRTVLARWGPLRGCLAGRLATAA